jgi:hypothetical protein
MKFNLEPSAICIMLYETKRKGIGYYMDGKLSISNYGTECS